MGASDRAAAALPISRLRPEPARRREPDRQPRPRAGVALEDRARRSQRADLPAGAAGEAAEAAGPRARHRAGARQRAGADRGDVEKRLPSLVRDARLV